MTAVTGDDAAPTLWTRAYARPIVVLAIAVAATLWQLSMPTGTDVSWLLTVGDRMLNGERLYVDVLESNPPASVLLYLPAVYLEHVAGLRAETAVVLATVAAAILGLWASAGILDRAGRPLPTLALAAGAVMMTALPALAFAQREHLALAAFLPLIALTAARGDGLRPGLGLVLATGAAAGAAMAIKPPFALAALLPALLAAGRARSIRPLLRPEYFAAAAVVIGYGIAIRIAYPAFFETMLPILTEVYLPAGKPLYKIYTQDGVIWLAILLVIVPIHAGRRILDPRIGTVWCAAVGFAAAFALQHKGWAYHALPAYTLGLMAAGFALLDPASAGWRMRRVIATVVGVACLNWIIWITGTNFQLTDLRERAIPLIAGKTVTAITGDISIASPLTRDAGGRFVGTTVSQWMSLACFDLIVANPDDAAMQARCATYFERDRAYLLADLVTRKPDVVLVERGDFDWLRWAGKDPAIAALFAGTYQPVFKVDDVEVWQRQLYLKGTSGLLEDTRGIVGPTG